MPLHGPQKRERLQWALVGHLGTVAGWGAPGGGAGWPRPRCVAVPGPELCSGGWGGGVALHRSVGLGGQGAGKPRYFWSDFHKFNSANYNLEASFLKVLMHSAFNIF